MDKRLEGRDEAILDPDLPIIDAHHHLFVRPGQRYLVDDYLADAGAGQRVAASVYVETMAFARDDGPEALRPLPEVEFANGVGAMTAGGAFGPAKVCAAIVGHAEMRLGDGIGRLLDRCLEAAPERFRGVRQVTLEHGSDAPFRFMPAKPPPGILSHPEFGAALRQVASRGLVFDASVFHHQLPALCAIADAHPGVTIALNHMGIALGFGMDQAGRGDVLGAWAGLLRDVARRPNVVCKVSGLGLPFWGFGFEERVDEVGYRELADAWRPYVETAVEAFGPDRCMAGSDFPPDGRSCGFVPLWNALKHVTAGLSSRERTALFHDTAARVYRIATPWTDGQKSIGGERRAPETREPA